MSTFFEIIMLLCFGAAWPFSIYKSVKTGANGSKSLIFLVVILMGYFAGILFKLTGNTDKVIFLYIFNSMMVLTDITIFLRNRKSGN
ncbi:MAG: hypothetical protein JXR95_13015 [Deltaproteobacteria bacterium]|nr:hypothetical protein [Deltaproteobacteria bacterium]